MNPRRLTERYRNWRIRRAWAASAVAADRAVDALGQFIAAMQSCGSQTDGC